MFYFFWAGSIDEALLQHLDPRFCMLDARSVCCARSARLQTKRS
jgi:hypothetical protein